MKKQFHANEARMRRHKRLRVRLVGTQERPRLSVFRSGTHIYAQLIDDTTGVTLASASSLEAALRDFKPVKKEAQAPSQTASVETSVEMAAEAAPTRGKGAKQEKAPARGQQQKSAQQQGKGGRPVQAKTVLPTAQKGAKKTPVEALVAIADNRKVAAAREVGKLIAQRAKEKGVSKVVFDRGGYAYHGRIAALAEGAREVGLDF
jgi:large subunit ribosomal protein L18